MRHRTAAASLAAATLVLAACAAAPPVTAGSDVDAEIVQRVRATARTRSDLMRLLGVPAAIFSPETTEPVPSIPDWGNDLRTGHSATLQDGAVAFELFRSRTDLRPDDRVYYWFHSRTTKLALVLPFAVSESAETSIARLWALVDARTEAVRGIAFLPAK